MSVKSTRQKVAISRSSGRHLISAVLGAVSVWSLSEGVELGAGVSAVLAILLPLAIKYFDTSEKSFGRTK